MKNKNIIRAAAWLLTLCSAIPVLASCGSDSTSAAVTAADSSAVTEITAETEPLDPLEARKLVDDELGEKDLGGYEFRVMVSEAGGRKNTIWVDGLTGDVVDDAVFERNAAVEERFNCKIILAAEYQNYSKLSPLLTKSVKAGDSWTWNFSSVAAKGRVSAFIHRTIARSASFSVYGSSVVPLAPAT